MILKDLETVDKQLKKEPDEQSVASVVIQPSAEPVETVRSQMSLRQDTSAQLSEQQAISSRLEQVQYIAPSGLTRLHTTNGNLTLNSATLTSMHNVGAAGMIGQYSPVATVAAAAAAAAAAASRASTSTPKNVQELGQTAGSSSGPVPGMLPVNAEVLGLKTMSASADGQQQQYIPPNQGTSQDWQSTVMSGYTSSPSPLGMAGGSRTATESDDSTRKRQVRLLKNREAAKECRRKKKEYVKCLENRVAVLENQNKALIEELKTLKELYCRKEKSEL
ncbi:bZIP transcription factor family protein [Loa loa]|nr:bZIP transcription factor family protein [Loa loa]EFO21719.2 bZIP transcription factor family protein [Loa loa]